jgi:hypothetical protein
MTVIEIQRPHIREKEAVRIAKRTLPQIFIAHSSMSKKLQENIEKVIRNERVELFFADSTRPIHDDSRQIEEIIQAIRNSDAFFVILTKNALKKPSIRDWIFFEMGFARAMWRVLSQYKMFVWIDATYSIPADTPLTYIKECKTFRINSKKSKDAMLEEMRSIARHLSMTH